jgi:putative glutamine amidotransferase
MQVLNVARGGSLLQDIPSMVGQEVDHRQVLPGRIPTHAIVLASGTRMEGVLGREPHDVNSFHHQAVVRLGDGLTAVAWAPDGVVEGVEAADRDFFLGVQWHAESLSEREDQAGLFASFVAAAARYGAAGQRSIAA